VPTPPPDTSWRDWAQCLLDLLRDVREPILAAHSAAGLLLPSLAEGTNASMLLFVDARLPPLHGDVPPVDAEFLKFIDTLPTEQGRVPAWSHWWGVGRMEKAITDPQLRAQFERDLPRLPRAWFDDTADVPRWNARRCGYLRLSKTYATEARDAGLRGWPLVEIDGTHLDPAIEPRRTADALLELVARMEPSTPVEQGR
jgi:alpha/beta hydrolase family protein